MTQPGNRSKWARNLAELEAAIREAPEGTATEIYLAERVGLNPGTVRQYYRPALCKLPGITWHESLKAFRFDPSIEMSPEIRNARVESWRKLAEEDPEIVQRAPEWIRRAIRESDRRRADIELFSAESTDNAPAC